MTNVTALALGRATTAAAVAHGAAQKGVPVLASPTLVTTPGDTVGLDRAVTELAAGMYVGVCLTSTAAVDALAEALARVGVSPEVLTQVMVGTVGAGTARWLEHRLGVSPSVTPPVAIGEALGLAFPRGAGAVLLPQSDLASPRLRDTLAARGYSCRSVIAYRTCSVRSLPPDVQRTLAARQIAAAAVTSPSCVRAWSRLAPRASRRTPVVSIGPVTTAACRTAGLSVVAQADRHDVDGVVEALASMLRPVG